MAAAAPLSSSFDANSCPRILVHKGMRLERLHLLGRGGFAKCFAFRNTAHAGDALVAVKVVDKRALPKSSLRRVAQEIAVHRTLAHEHIVALRHYFEDAANVYLLMDLCDGETVYDVVKRRPGRRVPELECRRWIFEAALAVAHLHDHCRIVHRDLKLGNLFLHQHAVKLGDFGLASALAPGERLSTVCGTPNYLAPEIIAGDAAGYAFEVDVWALGVCMFALLVGAPPFETNDVAATYRRIRANDYAFDAALPISTEARSLVRRLLDPLPAARPTAAALRDEPFFGALRSHAPAAPAVPPAVAAPAPAAMRSPLRAVVANTNKPATPTKRIAVLGADAPLVELFVDYRHKYGVGVALENGAFGAVFNDLSRILLLGDAVRYWDDDAAATKAVHCTVDVFPRDLYKKVTLIKYFREHLRESGAHSEWDGRSSIDALVSVVACDVGKQETVFHLSDGSVEAHVPLEQARVRIAADRRSAVMHGAKSATTTAVSVKSSAQLASLPPRVQRVISKFAQQQ